MSFVIYPETYNNNILLPFNNPSDYQFAINKQDQENVKNIVELVNTFDMKTYLTGELVGNILENKLPETILKNISKYPSYDHISIATIGENYRDLAKKINLFVEEKHKENNNNDLTKSYFDNKIISIYPTPREPLRDLIPTYSFRFSAKNPTSRDIVLGIHDFL